MSQAKPGTTPVLPSPTWRGTSALLMESQKWQQHSPNRYVSSWRRMCCTGGKRHSHHDHRSCADQAAGAGIRHTEKKEQDRKSKCCQGVMTGASVPRSRHIPGTHTDSCPGHLHQSNSTTALKLDTLLGLKLQPYVGLDCSVLYTQQPLSKHDAYQHKARCECRGCQSWTPRCSPSP